MGLIIFPFLSGVLFICDGLHVLGPSGPLIVKLGGSVMLPCYTEAPLPLEELEVEWKRTDSETLVHLFQDGESQPESQNQAYSGRASFFIEEVERGNFTLLLTNLTTKDAGVYRCSVYRQQATGQTSVEIEFLMVTGGHAVSAYAHEDVTLNCSVDSHIPPEELEDVSWMKVDQNITVMVFQEGEVLTDFTHERFRDRVEFFGPEEIHRGNFSLRIKNLRMEDKGLYRCEVLSGEFSPQTTVEIHLGFSLIHSMILILCSFTCLCGSVLLLGYITYTLCKKPGSCSVIIQHVLVFGPNILMFVAFILWGVLNGTFLDIFPLAYVWTSDMAWLMICICGGIFVRCFIDGFILVILFLSHEVIDANDSAKCPEQSKTTNKTSQLPFALIRRPFTIGAAVLFLVNSVTLAVELIRQAGEGERPVKDLRLILLPFEMAFVIICSCVFCRINCGPTKQNEEVPLEEFGHHL
ncbi:hypothetical protein MHYP_G00158530 [Metynnis hypsauchen]